MRMSEDLHGRSWFAWRWYCIATRLIGAWAWEPAKGPLDDAVDQGCFAGSGRGPNIRGRRWCAKKWIESQRPVGLRDSAERPKSKPEKWDGEILVPFAVESALSGVKKPVQPDERLWYRRTFAAPPLPNGGRLLLHFGAVDWKCTVWVNGKQVGEHTGGYDPFTFDITDALQRRARTNWSSRCGIRPTPALSRAASRCSSRTASCTRR